MQNQSGTVLFARAEDDLAKEMKRKPFSVKLIRLPMLPTYAGAVAVVNGKGQPSRDLRGRRSALHYAENAQKGISQGKSGEKSMNICPICEQPMTRADVHPHG